MRTEQRTRLPASVRGLGLGLLLACATGIGCGSESSNGGGTLKVVFSQLYTAHDGTRTFKVPVMVPSIFGVKWSVSSPSVAEIEAYEDDPMALGSEAMVIAKSPGTVTITASAGGLTGQASLVITGATTALWELGRARYQEGRKIRNDIPDATAACSNCHGMGGVDVEHTPAQIGGYSDEQVVGIFTMGVKPPGVQNRIVPFEQWSPVHRWQMTDEEKQGILVYLRSLEPQSHGTSDFGGRGVFRDNRGGGGQQ